MRMLTPLEWFRSILQGTAVALAVLFLLLSPLRAHTLELGQPGEVGMSAQGLARLDEVVEAAIANQETPGAVVLVARLGKIVYRKAFGSLSLIPKRVAMPVDAIFDVASMTKVVATATSIMILVEEGKLSLSDPVSLYLPDFEHHEKGSITILQLLTHYSGLRPDLDLDDTWRGYQTAIRRAFDEELVAMAGTQFLYSDINYLVLAEVVRQVSEMPLDEFSAEKIFEPLGMKHTSFNPPAGWRPKIAPTEVRNGTLLRGRVHDPTASRTGGLAGHAGLFSSADDLAIFAQMILNQGVYGKTRILSPLSVRQMRTNHAPPGQTDWRGIGFDIRSRFSTTRGDLFPVGSFGHTGFTGTSMWIDPLTRTFVILMTNRLHPNGKGNVVFLRKKVASVTAASILNPRFPPTEGALR